MTQRHTLSTRSTRHELQLQFEFVGDRFRHLLKCRSIEQGDAPRPSKMDSTELLCTSVEGTPADNWPPSPAFQEVSVESIEGKWVALATGQAGNSYWSASVSPVSLDPDVDANGFEFDVAIRTSNSTEFVGSTYQLSQPMQTYHTKDANGNWVFVHKTAPASQTQSGPTTLTFQLLDGSGTEAPDGRLVLRPSTEPPQSSDKLITLRWRYSLIYG